MPVYKTMKLQDPLDVKIKTNVCVRSLLEFGFPKDLIATDLNIPVDRVTEAESMFGGPSAFPPPVTDSLEYFRRFNDLLNNPQAPIEDGQLLNSIDRSRARILAEIFSRWFYWPPEIKKKMVEHILDMTCRARNNPRGKYIIGMVFYECECDHGHPDNNQH